MSAPQVTRLSVDTPGERVEDVLHDLTDGTYVVIAVEVFDDDTSKWSSTVGDDIGPWVLGRPDDVYRWLTDHSHEDFSEQYSEGLDCTPCPKCGLPTFDGEHLL